MKEVKREMTTASRKRRSELGWWMWGATKHLGRLADISLARRFGEHRFVIGYWTDEGRFSICSCGVAISGEVHAGMTIEEFLAAPGHYEMAPDDTVLSPTVLDRRLAACADDVARIEVLREWIAEVEEAMAATSPARRQGMTLWVWAARQNLERLTPRQPGSRDAGAPPASDPLRTLRDCEGEA
jgi:hypothetical protein